MVIELLLKMAKKESKVDQKKGNRRRWLWLVVVVAIVSLIGWKIWQGGKNDTEKAMVLRGEVVEELVLTGQIKAEEHASLVFQTAGEVAWMGAKEGDWVKKGQILAKLDTVSLNAAYQQALSNLRAAEATLERVYDEVKDNDEDEDFLTKEKRTAAEVAKDRAYEGVVMAQRNLRNAGIVAPFDGVVVSVTHPYSGINTTMAERQIELINPESVYFSVNADQTEVVDLKIGQEARIQLDAFSDEELIGEIEYIALAPKVGEVGAVYEVKIRFGEVDLNKFRVGMTGDVFLTRKQVSNVLYVPPRFVNSEKGEKFLLLDGGNKVKVEVGVEGEERVEVRGEVKEGDVIYD